MNDLSTFEHQQQERIGLSLFNFSSQTTQPFFDKVCLTFHHKQQKRF